MAKEDLNKGKKKNEIKTGNVHFNKTKRKRVILVSQNFFPGRLASHLRTVELSQTSNWTVKELILALTGIVLPWQCAQGSKLNLNYFGDPAKNTLTLFTKTARADRKRAKRGWKWARKSRESWSHSLKSEQIRYRVCGCVWKFYVTRYLPEEPNYVKRNKEQCWTPYRDSVQTL